MLSTYAYDTRDTEGRDRVFLVKRDVENPRQWLVLDDRSNILKITETKRAGLVWLDFVLNGGGNVF